MNPIEMERKIVARQGRKRLDTRFGVGLFNFSVVALFLTSVALLLCCRPVAVAKAVEPSGTIIGIDLGTTYSCVGVYKPGVGVAIIANDQGNRITPSYVSFRNGERLVGDAAKNQSTINPENTIFDVKRWIGRYFSTRTVQADRNLVPYSIQSRDNKVMISVNVDGRDALFAPEEISAMIMANLKATAEKFLGHEVKRAIVTFPAYFNDAQRYATKEAARIAGLEVERVLLEPTAAVMAYGFDNAMKNKNVVVFHLGGGTFDVTVLNIDDGVFQVMAISGDKNLGGEDFDQRVMQYFIKKIQETAKVDISKDKRALQKLRKETERVKRALSFQPQARLEIDDLVSGYDLSENLTRARFEEINLDLFQKTLGPVQEVLKIAEVSKADIDHIVLVGGSTRIPKIQQMLSEFFDGKEISKSINPDEAVAYGAAILGGVLREAEDLMREAGDLTSGIPVDIAPLSLGIETVGGVMPPIVNCGTTLPTKRAETLSTHQDNQSTVTIQVYEGERSMSKDNHMVGKFELTGIVPVPDSVPQIEVTFKDDANGILEVDAEDKETGKAEKIITTAERGRLSQEEIERMVHEAEEFAEEDKNVKELIDARNALESYPI